MHHEVYGQRQLFEHVQTTVSNQQTLVVQVRTSEPNVPFRVQFGEPKAGKPTIHVEVKPDQGVRKEAHLYLIADSSFTEYSMDASANIVVATQEGNIIKILLLPNSFGTAAKILDSFTPNQA